MEYTTENPITHQVASAKTIFFNNANNFPVGTIYLLTSRNITARTAENLFECLEAWWTFAFNSMAKSTSLHTLRILHTGHRDWFLC